MLRRAILPLLAIAATGVLVAAEGDLVFRSEVSLVRVDAQVVDRQNRAITGLQAEDFLLYDEGQPQAIRNFAPEDMPVDVLLLLDVSGSMQPHVSRVASAAHQALRVLAERDRVGIMVFDRGTRLRLPLRDSREDVERALEDVLRQESFDGGTDITHALLDAAKYLQREGRREARRAIVILTDDQTERGRDEAGVSRALAGADAVLSALLAPDAMGTGRPSVGSGGPWPGGSWPGGPLGDIIFGRRRYPGPVVNRPRTQSAGTAEIARRSGGDSLRVDDAGSLETTLARIRQRYALHFHLPEGAKPGTERTLEVALATATRRRYPAAEVRYRRVYLTPQGGSTTSAVISPAPAEPSVAAVPKRRPGVNEDGSTTGGWRRVDEPKPAAEPSPEPAPQPGPQPQRGWRRIKPGEKP